MDNPLTGTKPCISDGFRWVRRCCLHPCFAICCATQCLPTSLPQYDCLDTSGDSGRCICSTYGKRIREGPTRNIQCHQTHPPTEPAVQLSHDQSDSRRHLRDSTCDCLVSAIYGRTTLSPRESRDWGSPWSFSSTARRRRPGSIGSRSEPKRCTRSGSCLVSSTGPVFAC